MSFYRYPLKNMLMGWKKKMPSDVITTADFAYFRFHGPEKAYASKYSEDQLRPWADIIKKETENHDLKQIYCYFNNDNSGYAIENAKQMRELLG